jgi:RNA recognition motif-containing protein
MNIIVLNLSRKTTIADLTELFKVHGVVESCDIVMDKESGKSKGFAFVKMADGDEANAAIQDLDGKRVDGFKMRVKVSNKTK